jgi:hypothetical protein
MTCASMLFVRILDPNHPSQPYLSQCLPVLQTAQHDLCPVAGVQLSPDDALGHPIVLPEETLEVEVVVLPLVTGSDGTPDCGPAVAGLEFSDATGAPEADASAPPIGGRAYYHPGDAQTVVDLGCNDLGVLNTCSLTSSIAVDATVVDYPTDLAVTATVAQNLTVAVGEPTAVAVGASTEFMLPASATHALMLTATTPTPAWSGTIDETFQIATCIEVVEGGAQTTPTLACEPAVTNVTSIDFDGKSAPAGMRLARPVLNQLIAALPNKSFTLDHGLVLGIILDANGAPVANQGVAASDPLATIGYLTANGSAFTGSATAASGIFESTNAAFDTTWTLQSGAMLAMTGFGGLVDGMVTLVVLQFPPSSHM